MALALEEVGSSGPDVIAGRYVVEKAIAKGGMGAVYRVEDRATGRSLALKRLIGGGDQRRRARMFEREFHTLAGLKHPRIIEVYDYGLDPQGAYYTMELLDGRDLRDLAPLPYPVACRYLRDVASSLALLHARHLLHRDLSPRNVRITSDGRAKLIDFGALSSFGRSPTVVGTPPGIAPEGLDGSPLDQRTDLYALGALAYWVVTGRHAYDVRAVDELREAWLRPLVAPSLLLPHDAGLPPLPAELDDLIAALLSKNPLARPVNAAEVIARLSAIAGLEPDDEPLSAQSYLHRGKSVGRMREQSKLRRRVKAALAGRGSLVTIESEPGMGSASLVAELGIEARLLGATAVVVDARQSRGSYGVVDEIARALFATHPERARAAMAEHGEELARFAGADALSSSMRPVSALETRGDPREARMRTQAALLTWFERLARAQPLMLAVHHLHRADESSVALIRALCHGVAQARMLLVLAYDPDDTGAPASLEFIKQAERPITLRGLSRQHVQELVENTFGAVPHRERLAARLHELTSGRPQACIDLLRHLIEHDVVRLIDGMWVLPQEVSACDLPADVAEATAARLQRLAPDAHKLLGVLSVHRGPVPLERCLAMATLEGIAEPLRVLSELEQRGAIEFHDEIVRVSSDGVRAAALRSLADAERRRLHAAFGRLLAREDDADAETRLDAGFHLLHGGEERRGADLLAEVGVLLARDADRIPSAVPALEAALQVYRKLGRPKRELSRLLATLAIAGFFSDRRLCERYMDEALAAAQDVLGLSLGRKLAIWFGVRAGTGLGLACGWMRCALVYGPRAGRQRFEQTLMLFGMLVVLSTSLATLTLDAPRARRYAELLQPLRAVAAGRVRTIAEYLQVLAALPEDRIAQTIAGCRRIAERLEERLARVWDAEESLLHVNALYAWAVLETFRENPQALALADRLQALGPKLCEMLANQVRANYHGLRGEIDLAARYRQQVELFALQAGSSWLAEVWSPTSAILHYRLTRDAVGIRRVMAELDTLARDIPSLRRHAQLAHAGHASLQGDYEGSRRLVERALEGVEPRGFIGWGAGMAAQIQNLARLGEPEQARQLGLRVLSLLDAEDRTVTTMVVPIIVELSLADAELEPAAQRIEHHLRELGGGGGPVTRGSLHEARAAVALMAGDAKCAREHLARMQQVFLPTDNPALIGRCERLRREIDAEDGDPGSARDTLDMSHPSPVYVRRLLLDSEPERRAERALELLLDMTGAAGGYLFALEQGQLTLLSMQAGEAAPAALRAQVRQELEQAATESGSAPADATTRRAAPDQGEAHRVLRLAGTRRSGSEPALAVALIAGRRPLRLPRRALIATVADCIHEPLTTTSHSEDDAARGASRDA